MWSALWINVCLFTVIYAHYDNYVAAETEVRAYVDETVSLGCKVDVKQCGTLHSVKWYKDTSRIYVYSQAGSITRAEGDAEDRMTVEYAADSVQAVLKIASVKVEDEATYKCEITYLEVIENCDVVQIVKLQTLVRPKSVRILGNDGVSIKNSSVIGPKDEGTEIDLICEAIGGKPTPKVKWYNGTKEITRASYHTVNLDDGTGTGTSKLQLTLSRGDLNARFECRVESPALDQPIISWIMVDINVRPTRVSLSGVNNHVVQGTNVLLFCDVFGARPAATVRWSNESIPITNESLIETSSEYNRRDGTFTTKSSLTFKASQWENGRIIHCYAENEVLKRRKEPEFHELLTMEVRYPPVVSVSPPNITRTEMTSSSVGNELLLTCTYFANPQELKGVVWSKDGKNMSLSDPNKYSGGNIENPPLIITNITREDMGHYTCFLMNEVGSEQSPTSIFLNVQYPPDVNVIMEPSLPIKSVERSNVMLLCNVTSGNPSSLLKVRWFLDGDLMKEFPECNYTSTDENGVGEGSGGPFCGLDPSILSLERVDETFAGNYTCQGKNFAGWGPLSEPQELIVHYPPSPAKLKFYPEIVIKGASVTLICSVDHEGRPNNITYIWHRGSHQMSEITSSNFTIPQVGLETKNNFTCIAQNEGGQSEPSTREINVFAPPAFIQKLPPYQGILYSSQNINLTCRVECSPLCSIVWLKDGKHLDTNSNPLYYLSTVLYPPDLQKNDFESIESTLVWNMTGWPGNKLNKTSYNSHYTCKSHGNQYGNGVNSTIEIAVDYPPEDLMLSTKVVNVIENQVPDPVKCFGKGHPALTYQWKKNISSEAIQNGEELRLGAMKRQDTGAYLCEAKNKHGVDTATVYFNVQFAPSCTIIMTEKDGNSALVCTAKANPQEIIFTWKVREFNDTSVESSNTIHEGLSSYLILDSSVDTIRTYLCYANNSIGMSNPCAIDVDGFLPWWKKINLIAIIASIIVLILCVIVICIVIICLCRRKRADTKYNNPLEMEEREKPDGHSPNLSDQSKWPLRPGVLCHVSKMNHMNISQLSPRMSPFKTTSVTTSTILKYKRNKTKVYARLERLRDLLGFSRSRDHMPIGISQGASGVVTFKKFHADTERESDFVNPRKRKKPGSSPNPSSVGDKTRLGAAPPGGGSADPSTDPNNTAAADKGFYENLPFHGMQNPPNKPVSVIAPFNQGNPLSFTSSTTSLMTSNPNQFPIPFGAVNNKVKRNQSFHGFQNVQLQQQFQGFRPFNVSSRHLSNPYLHQIPLQQSHPNFYAHGQNQFIPTIYNPFATNMSASQSFTPNNPFQFHPNPVNRVHSFGKTNQIQSHSNTWNPFIINAYNFQPRIAGRRESKPELRQSNSNTNLQQISETKVKPENPPKPIRENKNKPMTVAEKRFGSLELKKHKCYSPTFYSMRCKKHAKKRPVIYALPKKIFAQLPKNNPPNISNNFSPIIDGVEAKEINENNQQSDTYSTLKPQPKPRCKKHRKIEIIYQNTSNNSLNKSNLDSSKDSSDPNESGISVTAEVQIHTQNVENKEKPEDTISLKSNASLKSTKSDAASVRSIKSDSSIKNELLASKVVKSNSKKHSPFHTVSTHAMKNSPTLKVSPNFIKPPVESPKGALSLQIQAKRKASPAQSPIARVSNPVVKKEDENSNIKVSLVPQMPITNTQNKRSPNNNTKQNAFYTLTTPHLKQLSAAVPPQYSATIPHQKRSKLLPKSLFQEQLPKSKSFSSKSKQKKHFQIPLQKCHSFKFQTAESYFQPIKNIHEENLMRNGYISDYQEHGSHHGRPHKREKQKQKTKGPLVLRRPGDYQENVHFQENMQNSVQLQYPQPLVGRNSQTPTNKPNGVVYADLDMPKSSTGKTSSHDSASTKPKKSQKSKPKTEYATLKFNDIGQEIDV